MDDAMRDYLIGFDPANDKTFPEWLRRLAENDRQTAILLRAECGEPSAVLDELWKDIPPDTWDSVLEERFGGADEGDGA